MLLQNMIIRPFAVADAEAVARVVRETLLTSNAGDYSIEELEALADWYEPRPLIARMEHSERFVAVIDTAIIGTAARRGNRIEGFFVAPSWQRHGVGEQLLAALEASAKREAMRAIWLESSVTAVGFYERHGYSSAGQPFDHGEGLVVPLRKRL